MPRIALVTSSKVSHLTADDRLLVKPLSERGIHGEAAIWDDPAVEWTSYDAIILRSPWDYHLKPEKFLLWIDWLEDARVHLWNPPALVRWNTDKPYLSDLAAKAIPIVPTFWPQASES